MHPIQGQTRPHVSLSINQSICHERELECGWGNPFFGSAFAASLFFFGFCVTTIFTANATSVALFPTTYNGMYHDSDYFCVVDDIDKLPFNIRTNNATMKTMNE